MSNGIAVYKDGEHGMHTSFCSLVVVYQCTASGKSLLFGLTSSLNLMAACLQPLGVPYLGGICSMSVSFGSMVDPVGLWG